MATHRLSNTQLNVIRVLWELGEAPTAAVHAQLAPRTGHAYTTVATLLKRLEERGLLAARRDGRELIYRALVSEAEVRRSMVDDMIEHLFRGEPGALVSHLVNDRQLTADDLAAIRRLTDAAEGQDDD